MWFPLELCFSALVAASAAAGLAVEEDEKPLLFKEVNQVRWVTLIYPTIFLMFIYLVPLLYMYF